jgi:hypothetical protein
MFSMLVPWLAELHQEALLEEAKESRLAARGWASKPRLEERVLVALGTWLISIGLRLQARYRPEMRPAPESCSPACG